MRTYNATDIQTTFRRTSTLGAVLYRCTHKHLPSTFVSQNAAHTFASSKARLTAHTQRACCNTASKPIKSRASQATSLSPTRTYNTSKPVNTAQAHTLTTHFNIILGNIPKHFRQAETINSIFRHTWTNCRQSEDVHTQTIIGSSKGLNFYVLKEAHYDKQKIVGDISTWDIDNTFIPNAAVYAD